MAVSTDSYFNNAIVGQTQVGGGVNIYASSTEPKYALGTAYIRSDGAVFRYAHFGAASTAGLVVSQDISESGLVQTVNACIAPASAVAVAGDTMKPGSIGSRYIEVTIAAVTADMFAGGYLSLTGGTGAPAQYRIKGNTATGNPAAGNIRLELYEPLVAAINATTDIQIAGSLYANLEPATAATDPFVAGVTLVDQAAADYGWVQTKGIVTVLQDGAFTIGCDLTLSDGVAGALQLQDAYTEPFVGYAVVDAGTGTYGTAKINLE